jgi:hypothetical protein
MLWKKKVRVPIWAKQTLPQSSVNRRAVFKIGLFIIASGGLIFGTIEVLRRLEWRHFARQVHTFSTHIEHWQPALLPVLLFVGLVSVFSLWGLPKFQVARLRALTDEKRFDRENEARKTLAQILAGVFLLAGLYSSVQTFNLSREGQITDRFTKAIEQLGAVDAKGNPKLQVRLGGIYALERIAHDSERDHQAIMEILTTYIREHAPATTKSRQTRQERTDKSALSPRRPSADIQAILTVIGRRQVNYDKANLDLRNADLRGANLSLANLRAADLSGADLSGAVLSGADLSGAVLSGAVLIGADLSGANLFGADLIGAVLIGAHLSGAYLSGADLRLANLSEADLSGANLIGAHLSGADLSEARDLTQEQINHSSGNRETQIPKGLEKPHEWLR